MADATDSNATDSNDSDSDSDSNDSNDSDSNSTTEEPPTTSEESEETGDPPPEICEPSITEGFYPYFSIDGFGEGCPPFYSGYVQVIEETLDGGWLAVPCQGPCDGCFGDEVEIDVAGLGLAATLPLPDPQDPDLDGCYYLEVEFPLGEDFDRCIYGSMSIFSEEGDLPGLVLHANRESHGPFGLGHEQLEGWFPPTVAQGDAEQCLCEDTEVECCPGEIIVPRKFEIQPGDYVYPGDSKMFSLGDQNAVFFAGQAQSGVSCELDPETSWALLRE